MTTRQFDPVFSAALRNELEALVDAPKPIPAKGLLLTLRKPQVWISIVTAAVLVAATIGLLQVTHGGESAPAGRSRVADPLTSITNPSSSGYVAREVQTLLHVSATGPGAHDFSVPTGVTSLRVYVNCAPTGKSGVGIDGDGKVSGECSRVSGLSYDMPIDPGTHEVEVTVKKGTDYTLLLMASPAPTVSTGALIDPLAQVRDLRNPDALVGDTSPVLDITRTAGDGRGSASTPLHSSDRLRAYFVCRTSSSTAEAVVDGHTISGCMNSIAHWFDFTPRSATLTAQVDPTGDSALLVVPAPKGAKDSPANTTLRYPKAPGTALGRARGAGTPVSGTYRRPGTSIVFTVSCRGTGWLEMTTTDGGTTTRGTACSALSPQTSGFGGDSKDSSLKTWSVIPHCDISWTFQISTDD